MKINIKTTNIDLTDALSAYVEEKIRGVEKFMAAHEHEDVPVYVEVGKTSNHHHAGDIFRAEANVTVRGKHFRAVSKQSDLYSAIDDMRSELVREINSYKGKERTLFRRGAGAIKNLLRFGREK